MKSTLQTIGLVLLVVLTGVAEISRSGAKRVSDKKPARIEVAKQAVRVDTLRDLKFESVVRHQELMSDENLDEGSDNGAPLVSGNEIQAQGMFYDPNHRTFNQAPYTVQAASAAAASGGNVQQSHLPGEMPPQSGGPPIP